MGSSCCLGTGVGIGDLEKVLPVLSNSEACAEVSADRFECGCTSCFQTCSFPDLVFPKLFYPPPEFAFLALLSFFSPASKLSPVEMLLLEGVARRKPLAVGTSSVALIYHSTSLKCFPSFFVLEVWICRQEGAL